MDRVLQFVICTMILFLSFSKTSAELSSNDQIKFRNVYWGMTRLDVMASEAHAPEVFGLSAIIYKPVIDGREFHLIYEFIENKLANAEYRFVAHTVGEYLWLKRMLVIKHGQPVVSRDGGYENFEYKWKKPETEITLKPGNKRECLIEYKGLKYLYLKTVRERKLTVQKEDDIKKTF